MANFCIAPCSNIHGDNSLKATDRGGEERTGEERSGASAPARNNADKLRWPSVQENQPNPKTPRVRLDES